MGVTFCLCHPCLPPHPALQLRAGPSRVQPFCSSPLMPGIYSVPASLALRSSKPFADPAGKMAVPWSAKLSAKLLLGKEAVLKTHGDLGCLYEQALCPQKPQGEGAAPPGITGLSRWSSVPHNYGSVVIQAG